MTTRITDLIENHGINAIAFSIGEFAFTKRWMNFMVRSVGGFVGKVERKDRLSSGLYAIIPSEDMAAERMPTPGFIRKLEELEIQDQDLFLETLRLISNTLIGEQPGPKLEASFQNENVFIDTVRGLFVVQSGRKLVREEVGDVSTEISERAAPIIIPQRSDEVTYHVQKDSVGMVMSRAQNGEVIYVIPMQEMRPTAISMSMRTAIIYGLRGIPMLIATLPAKCALLQRLSPPTTTTVLELDSNFNWRATELKITLGSSRASSSS